MLHPTYEAPRTVADAVRVMQSDPQAKVLAGGTDLIVQYHTGRLRPSTFVDLKRVPELLRIEVEDEGLRLGAAVAAVEITEHPEIGRLWPGLVEAVSLIGSTQIQGRATVGGNLCNGSPAADTTCPLIVNRARALIAGPDGERTVDVEDFTTGPGTTVLRPGEVLVALLIPRPAARTADAYVRLIPRTEMDIAAAGAAVSVTLDSSGTCMAARLAIGAVAPTPLLVPEAAQALVGTRMGEEAIRQAGAAASAAAKPIDDRRGTAAYRRTVVGVLTRRAAATAVARARARKGD